MEPAFAWAPHVKKEMRCATGGIAGGVHWRPLLEELFVGTAHHRKVASRGGRGGVVWRGGEKKRLTGRGGGWVVGG